MYLRPVSDVYLKKGGQIYGDNVETYISVDGVRYPVTEAYVAKEYDDFDNTQAGDFSFVIYRSSYEIIYRDGEDLDFTVDWGDGTETIVNSTDAGQLSHAYARTSYWTITIKNYVSGWIHLGRISYYQPNTSLALCLREVLTPFPASMTRVSFEDCFRGCENLTSIPGDLFARNPNAQKFTGCFCDCVSLKGIPEKLFFNNIAATHFGFSTNPGCFYNCKSLTSIPERLFANNPNVTNFTSCFENCSGLTSIPEQLFAYNPNVYTFSYDSEGISGASYNAGCFSGCINITAIPENLFAHNTKVKIFGGCFAGCKSLATLPENLFANNKEVVNFTRCFSDCSGLISMHENLFKYNTKARMFSSAFQNCSSLRAIPEKLFYHNVEAYALTSCFLKCMSIEEMPTKLFDNCPNIYDFTRVFSTSDSSSTGPVHKMVGLAPEIWKRTNVGSINHVGTFHGLENLYNYADIPSSWK